MRTIFILRICDNTNNARTRMPFYCMYYMVHFGCKLQFFTYTLNVLFFIFSFNSIVFMVDCISEEHTCMKLRNNIAQHILFTNGLMEIFENTLEVYVDYYVPDDHMSTIQKHKTIIYSILLTRSCLYHR